MKSRSRSRDRRRDRGRRSPRRRSYSRSRSRSRGKTSRRSKSYSRQKSRSRSRSDSKKREAKRVIKTGLLATNAAKAVRPEDDLPPTKESIVNNASSTTAPPNAANDSASHPSITQMMQQFPTMSLQDIIAKMQTSNVPLSASVSMKSARELYVGNLPPNVTAPQLQEFLGTIIQQVGLATQPGNPIISTWISTDGHFAFCELRSVEECNLALMLNQLSLLGQPLKFGRPRSFMGPPQIMPVLSARTQTALVNLGCTPNPDWFAGGGMSLGASGRIGANAASGQSFLGNLPSDSTSNKLVMMNIPTVLTEEQVNQLVEPFGELNSFCLLKEQESGNSAGCAVFEYKDEKITEEAIKGLNGLDIGGAEITVQRAPDETTHPEFTELVKACSGKSVQKPTAVIKLENMVQESDLNDDEEYEDLKLDVEEECEKFGKVEACEIPRPKNGETVSGTGNIYVRFETSEVAAAAIKGLKGRKFAGKLVEATYYPVDKFESKSFE